MDPKDLPVEYRKSYLHLLFSRISVEAIPPGTPEGQGLAKGLDWLLSLRTKGKLRSNFKQAAKTIDPMLEELARATTRERGTLCSFGEAAQLAFLELQKREEEKHPWKKILREAKESQRAAKSPALN